MYCAALIIWNLDVPGSFLSKKWDQFRIIEHQIPSGLFAGLYSNVGFFWKTLDQKAIHRWVEPTCVSLAGTFRHIIQRCLNLLWVFVWALHKALSKVGLICWVSTNMSFQGWDLERSHITIEVYSGCLPSEFSDETWCVHHPG
jgi:hypothetical protein